MTCFLVPYICADSKHNNKHGIEYQYLYIYIHYMYVCVERGTDSIAHTVFLHMALGYPEVKRMKKLFVPGARPRKSLGIFKKFHFKTL